MFDVITIGSATVDAFAETDKRFVKGKNYSYPIGAKIKIKKLSFDTGGGGTNTAVSFSRLGLRTAFLGKMGSGSNSERIIKQLKKEKINTSLIYRESARTGYSVILDAKGRDRTILTYRGSNADLGFSEIKLNKLKTRWVYSSSLTGNSFNTLKKIISFLKKSNTKIAFNPSLYLIKEKRKGIEGFMHNINILVFNKEEAEELVGNKTAKKSKGINKLLKAVYKFGPELVVITDSKNGSFCYDGVHKYTMPCHGVRIVETTGAGDAYASTFVAAIIKNETIEKAMQCATINAESVIQHIGAKNKLLKWREVLNNVKDAKKVKKVII